RQGTRVPDPHRPGERLRHAALAVAIVAVVAFGAAGGASSPKPAAAAVTHQLGFRATVAGWTSWYGSYGMGGLGVAWCIDHGIRAPDPDYGYVPTDPSEPSADTKTAMAWLLSRHGASPDRVGAAALMLVLHDLMGAVYPSGRLDVDRLDLGQLAGFEGLEAAVLERARGYKADALAHAHLRLPFRLDVTADAVPAGTHGQLRATLVDANGAPVAGAPVAYSAAGATTTGPTAAETGADGTATFGFVAGGGAHRFDVLAGFPDLRLDAFAPTARPAQRVARPAHRHLVSSATFDNTPPPGTLTLRKTGDATAYLPVEGARFEVLGPDAEGEPTVLVGELVAGADGATGVLTLPPGRYLVRETTPPAGYEPGGPWEVDVPPGGAATVEAANTATRGAIAVRKVDDQTGEALDGATFEVFYDADADGTAETGIGRREAAEGEARWDRLAPGRYRLVEVAAPDGYLVAPEPVDLTVEPGDTAEVVVANSPAPPNPTTTVAARATLPRTGGTTQPWVLLGAGLVVIGVGCSIGGRGSASYAGGGEPDR
ncbi:MAG: Ig-like domain-containing protein, partial [Proteobacteria bacterium]|nr:Ig-like domain-containing protein [Pseudomonadota bacterium]